MKMQANAMFLALTFLPATVAQAIPDYDRQVTVADPSTGARVSLFEDDQLDHEQTKTYYYQPQVLRMVRDDGGKPVFHFNFHDKTSGSSTSFKMRLVKPKLLENKPDYVRKRLAAQQQVDKQQISIMPLHFENTETKLNDFEGLVASVLPPKWIGSKNDFSFFLRLSNQGTARFQQDVIDSSQTLGTVHSEVKFRVGADTERKTMSFAIELDEVPPCAVSAGGC